MFLNWFKSKRSAQLRDVRNAAADLERFLASLKALSDQELGTVVAMAAIIRVELREKNRFPDAALGIGVPLPDVERDDLRRNLSGLVQSFQQREHPSTSGAMVWLHSLRAFHFPEVRMLGRQMWAELERGFPHVVDAFRFIEETVKMPLPSGIVQASRFIPVGLERSHEARSEHPVK